MVLNAKSPVSSRKPGFLMEVSGRCYFVPQTFGQGLQQLFAGAVGQHEAARKATAAAAMASLAMFMVGMDLVDGWRIPVKGAEILQ